MSLYQRALASPSPGGVDTRVDSLKRTLQVMFPWQSGGKEPNLYCGQGIAYEYTARSLFKADRLMFSLHVVRGMQADMFLEGEWDFFIGLLVEAGTEDGGSRAPSWLEAERQGDAGRLLATFPGLSGVLGLEEGGQWAAFMKAETPERDFPVQVTGRGLTLTLHRPHRWARG